MADEKKTGPYSWGAPDGVAAPPVDNKGNEVANLLNGVIHHPASFAHVQMQLSEGQEVLSDGGAMIWKHANVRMETQVGECIPACWRKWAGESCCQVKYTGPGMIAFSFKLPGDMKAFAVTNEVGWKVGSGAFVCGTIDCIVSMQFGGIYSCVCGGEDAWLTKVTTESEQALFYAGGYGAIARHELADGATLAMSKGAFFAAPEDQPFELRMPGGFISCRFGGEGLVMAMAGPGVVYTQNRNPDIWKMILRREGPKNNKKGAAQ